MDKVFPIFNMQEKKEGWGEDSNPILYTNNDTVLTGVFDGMGGAGGAECESDFSHDGIHMTKAYVGSRIVRDAIEKAIQENPTLLFFQHLSEELESIIACRYTEEKKKYPAKSKAGLRSSLIKEYPTTLAMTCVNQTAKGYEIKSLWAGDSRNYLWKKEGLFQISIDDLKGNLDPMQNLREDAPMSNCIQADAPFRINYRDIILEAKEKFIVISATDGCFGYYPSPMDFEKVLAETLEMSNSIQDFKECLTSKFAVVTADDFSFAIAAIGFKDFTDMKKSLSPSNRKVKEYFNKRNYYEGKLKKFEEKIEHLKKGVNQEMMALWPEYKDSYLKFMESYERR